MTRLCLRSGHAKHRFAAGARLALVVLAGVVAVGPAACGGKAPAPAGTPNDVVARVNGVPITRAAMERAEKVSQLSGTTLTDRDAVEQLISAQLISQQAKKRHVSVSTAELKARVAALATMVGGTAVLQAELKGGGLTMNDLEASLQVVMLGEKLQVLMFYSTQASRAQALAYYGSRKSLFHQDAAVRLAQIAVRSRKIAEAVIARIKGGQPFSNAALQFSLDLSSKENGGMVGWVDVASVPKPVAAAIAKLKVGEVSAPVALDGWHIYKLYGRRPAGTLPFAQVGDVIRSELTRQKRSAALTKWVERQRTNARVQILF